MIKRFWMAILTILCSIGITIAVSYAWFLHDDNVDPIAQGYSGSAYFAYGNGEDKPYGINTPRHLYNLAWLCYLFPDTYASKKYEIDPNLKNDPQANGILNMTGWVLPPIGTDNNPFLGEFNGNGVIISNLTTSNNFKEDIKNVAHPSSVTSISGCNNMGFFGNIGPTSGTASDSNKVYNFYLRDNIVKTATSTSNTYFGAAAGYVNATMENVGVISGTLNNTSSNTISEYSVVGHSTNAYLTALNKKSTIIYNPTNTNTNKYTYEGRGTSIGWGGSIDMLSFYKNLRDYWNTFTGDNTSGSTALTTTSIPYYTTQTLTYSDDGSISYDSLGGSTRSYISSSSITSGALTYNHTTGTNSDVRFYSKEEKNGNNTATSISYVIEPSNVGQYNSNYDPNNEWRYMCLTGYANRTLTNQNLTITHNFTGAVSLNDGSNYLSFSNENTVSNESSKQDALKWYVDDSNHYYTFLDYGSNDSTKYYLIDNNGTLKLSETASSTWVQESNTLKSNMNHYLVYNNGWKLQNTTSVTRTGGSTIKSGNYYLNQNGTRVSASTDNDTATIWYVDNNNNIYTYVNTTMEYLYYTNDSNISVGSSTSNRYQKSRRTIQVQVSTGYYYPTTYYIYLNGTNWATRTNSTNLTWTSKSESYDFNLNIDSVGSYQTTSNPQFETPDTYIPLMSTDGIPDNNNTGYLVSGARYYSDAYGDIRVSAFPLTDLNSGDSSLSTVYTWNDEGSHVLSSEEQNAFKKFKTSKAKLTNVLSSSAAKVDSNTGKFSANGTSYVFGLHFMDCQISTLTPQGHETRIPYAKINGQEYNNYQVPQDCIDFNLKEKGYINFFAGTYYQANSSKPKSRNSSFFALYDIFRNGVNIVGIKEIAEIYKDASHENYSYVYKYSDGTFSKPFLFKNVDGVKIKYETDNTTPYVHSFTGLPSDCPDGYDQIIFKTSWIKGHKDSSGNSLLAFQQAYYFEIPVNDGEYCLGSVSGYNGAYLMYLDIGANATEVYRSEITQKTTIKTEKYTYPSGVAIIENKSNPIIPRDSAVAKITSSGEHSISASGTTIIVTGASDSSYINPDVVLSNGTTSVNASGTDPSTTTLSQLMLVDYIISDTRSTYVTLVTSKKTGDSNPILSSEYYLLEGQGVPDDQGGWGLFKTPINSGDALISVNDESDFTISVNNSNIEKEKHYYFSTKEATTTDDIKMVANGGTVQDDGKYYSCAGDNIYITTDETIKLYVTQKDALIYKFFFNLDMEDYPYPSNQTDVPVQTIDEDENYEYVFSQS